MMRMAEKVDLDQVFKRLTGIGVFVLDPGQEKNLLRLAEDFGFHVFSIDALHTRSKHELLAAFADALSFPDYFGYNWDALDECIRDLSWLRRGNFLLVFQSADHLLGLGVKDFAVLIDLLGNATFSWKAEGVVFSVVLLGGADVAAAVEHTLAESG